MTLTQFRPVLTFPCRAIETIGAYFDAFSQALGEITGWKFTLLAGGPNPVNGGRIRTIA